MLLGPFHLFRSGGQLADIAAVNSNGIHYAQFCDASASAPSTLAAISEEARFDRWLPGEGGLPLHAFESATARRALEPRSADPAARANIGSG
jgi:sugar phosphate isomerase/epimerase